MTVPRSPYRRLRSVVGRIAREAALYPRILGAGRGQPRIAFLPSHGPEQSSLLRAYHMADQLRLHGWQSIVLPKELLLGQRNRVLRRFRPDLVVVQQCRHVLNRLRFLTDWPLVLDIDDADFLDPKLTDELEAMARHARGVVCGSRYIRDWALGMNPNSEVIWTGTPISRQAWPPHSTRAPILTWAQSSPIGYPAEFGFVRKLLPMIVARQGALRFRLYGWDAPRDHPVIAELRAAGVEVELMPFMAYGAFIATLREVAVGLSPIVPVGFGRGKSFGKILAYLDAGVPVVCSDEADHALFFSADTGVVSNDPAIWVDAIVALLADPARRDAMAEAAGAAFADQLSTSVAGERLRDFLTPLVPAQSRSRPET